MQSGKGAGRRQPGARRALLTLTCINGLNFADRYVLSAVKEDVKAELKLSDAQTALPMTGMAVVMVVFAALFSFVADKRCLDRIRIISLGIALWSVATALAGMAKGVVSLVFFRSLVGIGEAAYGVLSGPIISDYYPPHERTIAFAFFNVAAPFGGALGFGAGGLLASTLGWRAAFMMVGCPGILAAFLVLRVRDPVRGLHDDFLTVGGAAPLPSGRADNENQADDASSATSDLRRILTNPHYLVATAGGIAINFAIGGIADWGSSFLQRYDGASTATAGLLVGSVTAIAGISGNFLGAKTVEHFERRVPSAAFLVPGLYTLPAAALTMLVINWTGSLVRAYVVLLGAQTCLWTFMAPIQNLSLSVLSAELRARSNALSMVVSHLLGDIPSPPIIGAISDATGSLISGMQLVWVAMLLAGGIWLFGFSCLARVNLAADQGGDAAETSFRSLLRPDTWDTECETSADNEEETVTAVDSSSSGGIDSQNSSRSD